MYDLLIAPSILSADFSRLGEEVSAIDSGGADFVHVDVMDGHFVPNLTFGPPVVAALRKATDKVLDVHLMIENAEVCLEAYAEAGADIISVHVEACSHLHRTVQEIHNLGKKACVALNPGTPLSLIDHVVDELDMVLIMTVNPGFGGQSFIDSMLTKIRTLRALSDQRGLHLDIEVDGGIKVENTARVVEAGANVLVSGSGIFGTDDYGITIATMRDLATAALPEF
jgi:ribulose-phosphate 3-epimerase